MRISDLFKMGLKNLSRRKARTILTVLGVIIGSLSIIIMVSIGNGMNNNFNSQVMQQGGLTTINVYTWADVYDEKGNWIDSKRQKLDNSLVKKLEALDHVRAVTPVINVSASLIHGRYMGWVYITAMDYKAMKEFDFPELDFGEYPNEDDLSPIIFGYNQPYEFYDPYSRYYRPVTVDVLTEKIDLKFDDYPTAPKKKPFSITLKNKAKMVQTNGEYDYSTYMDITYFKELYLKYCNTLTLENRKKAIKTLNEYSRIMMNVDHVDNVVAVQKEIEALGFKSNSMMQYLEPLKEASETLQMVLGALGAVAMIVSAISIANTMIMSIYERTKEIGIMKVLGCMIKDIRKLFLFEAGIIGLFGGIIGVGLGYIAAWAINKFGAPVFQALMSGNYMYDMTNTKFCIIPIYLPVLSVAISVAVGLISGYFPARRATKISAIEAMKTDG